MKDVKKKGRGAYDNRSDEGNLICEWRDNRVALVPSNIHGVEPTHKVRSYKRKHKTY